MKLNIVPIPDVRLVPRELLEQVKDREFDVEEWYQLIHSQQVAGQIGNVLLGFVDDDAKIKGILWAEVDLLHKALFINLLSVDKEHWGGGKIVEQAAAFIADLVHKIGLKKALWRSSRPKAYEKHGFSVSKNVLLEQDLEEWRSGNVRRRRKDKGSKRRPVNPRSEKCDRAVVSPCGPGPGQSRPADSRGDGVPTAGVRSSAELAG